jgi:peroxiredoxin
MKTRLFTFAFILSFGLVPGLLAQAPKGGDKGGEKKAPAPKSAADLALDEFNKVRNENPKDQSKFDKVIAAGVNFLVQNPTHNQANAVVNNLAFYATGIDRKQPALRTSYQSFLKLEVANQKYKDGVSDAAKAALVAVEAASADFEVRETINRDTMMNFREKIDALAETPGSGRFLADREKSFLHLTALSSPPRAEEHAKKLLEHKEKGVRDMARAELNILETKKQPFEATLTTLDGKQVDFAQLRGKVVALYFWSTTHKGSTDRLEALRQVYADNRKKGLEVVTVSYDKEEDREKLLKFIKDNRVNLPVYFDGKGAKADFVAKLNVNNVPRLLVFDQKGILYTTILGSPIGQLTPNLDVNQLEGIFKTLTTPAKK